jgi:hypothetical protein
VERVSALGGLALTGLEFQVVADPDPLDHQDAVLDLHLAPGLGVEPPLAGRDLARLQRAPEGAGESAGGGRDHVVERGRVGLVLAHVDAVVAGHRAVDAEQDRARLGRQVRAAERPADALDADVRGIGDGGSLVRGAHDDLPGDGVSSYNDPCASR